MTFAYDHMNLGVPHNPRFIRVRADVAWKEVLLTAPSKSLNGMKKEKEEDAGRDEKTARKERRGERGRGDGGGEEMQTNVFSEHSLTALNQTSHRRNKMKEVGRNMLEKFALSKNMDPHLPSTWYSFTRLGNLVHDKVLLSLLFFNIFLLFSPPSFFVTQL